MPNVEIPNFARITDYVEMPGCELVVEDGKMRGKRIFRVLNYNRHAEFMLAIAGGVTFNGSEVAQVPPLLYRSDLRGIYCKTASHRGIGIPSRLASGDETYSGGAEVTVGYGTLDYDPTAGGGGSTNNPTPAPYVTESRSTGGTVLTLQKKNRDGTSAWKWVSDDVKLDENAPDIIKVQCEGTYTLTRHFVPVFPKAIINGCIGKVNSGNFPTTASLGGYGPQELLFLGDESSREFFADGSNNGWTIALKFGYKPETWNTLYRQDTGRDENVVNVGSGFGPFLLSTDFPKLLGQDA